MAIDQAATQRARQFTLWTAKNLITEAVERQDREEDNAAEALVITVLRVLDGYEAIAQLPDVHDIAGAPGKPIPYRFPGPRDA